MPRGKERIGGSPERKGEGGREAKGEEEGARRDDRWNVERKEDEEFIFALTITEGRAGGGGQELLVRC